MSVEVRREEVGVWSDGVEGRGDVIVDIILMRRVDQVWRCDDVER